MSQKECKAMQDYFLKLNRLVNTLLENTNEVILCHFSGELSDFIRFNHGKVRQVGSVEQRVIELELIQGKRSSHGYLDLTGELETDEQRLKALLFKLREHLAYLPEDPHLNYSTEIHSTGSVMPNDLHDAKEILADILRDVEDSDFVGHYAGGATFSGFFNTLGQLNWHNTYSFNLDWSLYHTKDKAVKNAYAGFQWNSVTFLDKMRESKQQLDILKRDPITIEPGKYKVFLAPSALYEIISLLCWGGFSAKELQTKQSPLLRMQQDEKCQLHPTVTIRENIEHGLAPAFQEQGFLRPQYLNLIEQGKLQNALVSPRTAKEYNLTTNGANCEESPISIDMEQGSFSQKEALKTLDTGIYIHNLWYLNYSDRASCRITGMTRFASFWVEKGEIVAPLNVMRFDESLYNLLGSNLIALTREREFIMDTSTYEKRSVVSARLPGALISDFNFTL
jgi:predicted Zn-dependent protease